MTVNHVVVDGSNLATEGRTLPSLQQLDDAVRAYLDEFKPETVTVIVDASFPNRIDDSERAAFEEALLEGELLTPPAGVIGRGDAFLLQIADRANAVVLSNDSFQEFHGQYSWLFDQGRLIGGKPVPHVGWVFMERSPVRGPLSRKSVSDAKKAAKKKSDAEAAPVEDAATDDATAAPARRKRTTPPSGTKPGTRGRARRGARGRDADAEPGPVETEVAPAAASGSVGPAEPDTSAESGGRGRRRRSGANAAAPASIEPYNDALPFIEFVSAHPVGSTVAGEVERFASHGAYVLVEGTRCYLPLKHLGEPAPRSAREVLSFGETYTFVVHAFDTPRRGVDLTMPDVVPSDADEPAPRGAASDPVTIQPTEEDQVAPAKKAAAKKAPAKKAVAKKAPAKKAVAKKAPAKKAPVKKAVAKKAPAKKAPVKKAVAKKAPAKKAPVKKAVAKAASAVKTTAKKAVAKAPAKKTPAKKAAAKKGPAKKA
jgi:hypothetical protein